LRKENRELRREKDFSGWRQRTCQRAAAAESFRLISRLTDRFSVAWLCKQLGVACSRFYALRQRQQNPGPRAQENAAITAQVQEVFQQHRGLYGAPRIHQELRAAGFKAGRHHIARLMRRSHLKAIGEAFSGGADQARVQTMPQQHPQDRWSR
jgi:hypothetical protein